MGFSLAKFSMFYIDGQNFHQRVLERTEQILRKDCLVKAKNQLTSSGVSNLTDSNIERLANEKYEKRKFKEVINSRHIDLWSLCNSIREKTNAPIISEIKYYGARFPAELDQGKHNSDHIYYRNLEKNGIKFVEGRFLWDKDHFKKFGKVKDLREKGVDVNIAVDLMIDAENGKYNHAFVISQDSDLIPAYENIELRKKRKIHVRTINKFKGFDKSTDTNETIPIWMLKNFYNPTSPPASSDFELLKQRFK